MRLTTKARRMSEREKPILALKEYGAYVCKESEHAQYTHMYFNFMPMAKASFLQILLLILFGSPYVVHM